MFRTTDVEIDIPPVGIHLLIHQCLIVVRIHVAQIVGRGTGKARHRTEFQREDSLMVNLGHLDHLLLGDVPRPTGRMA